MCLAGRTEVRTRRGTAVGRGADQSAHGPQRPVATAALPARAVGTGHADAVGLVGCGHVRTRLGQRVCAHLPGSVGQRRCQELRRRDRRHDGQPRHDRHDLAPPHRRRARELRQSAGPAAARVQGGDRRGGDLRLQGQPAAVDLAAATRTHLRRGAEERRGHRALGPGRDERRLGRPQHQLRRLSGRPRRLRNHARAGARWRQLQRRCLCRTGVHVGGAGRGREPRGDRLRQRVLPHARARACCRC